MIWDIVLIVLSAAIALYCLYRVSEVWSSTALGLRIIWVCAMIFWFLSWAVLTGHVIDTAFGIAKW